LNSIVVSSVAGVCSNGGYFTYLRFSKIFQIPLLLSNDNMAFMHQKGLSVKNGELNIQ